MLSTPPWIFVPGISFDITIFSYLSLVISGPQLTHSQCLICRNRWTIHREQTLSFKEQAQIPALSNGWWKWLINTLTCASFRAHECSASMLVFCLILVRLVHWHTHIVNWHFSVPVFFYLGAPSAGRHANSSVPPEYWQMSPPACLTLVIKTSCLLSHPEATPCWSDCSLWNNLSIPSNKSPNWIQNWINQSAIPNELGEGTGNSTELFMKMLKMSNQTLLAF